MSKIWKPLSKSLRVLNRLNSGKKDREDTINQDTIRSLALKHELVQQRIFTRWINLHLASTGLTINSFEKDLKDGHILHALLKQLTKEPIPDIDKKSTRFHHLSNVSISLAFLEAKLGELPNIGSIDIVDGNLKLTLGLVWLIILRFQIQQALKIEPRNPSNLNSNSFSNSLDQTAKSLEFPTKSSQGSSESTLISKSYIKDDPKSFLLDWVRCQLRAYEGLIAPVRDFHSSWQNGVAFAALIHRHDPSLITNLSEIVEKTSQEQETWREVLDMVFKIALENMGVPSLLEPDDILSVSIPDEKIIMMYVTEFYKVMSSKQQSIDLQEFNSTKALVDQCMQLAESIRTQLDQLYDSLYLDQFDLDSPFPNQFEVLGPILLEHSRFLEEYESTVQTLDRSATSLSVTLSKIDTGLMHSVTQTRDNILERWRQMEEKLQNCENALESIKHWGELSYTIHLLESSISEQGSLCSEYMEMKISWSENEKFSYIKALEKTTHECQSLSRSILESDIEKAPRLLQDNFRRCKELLEIASINLEQFQIDLEVTKYTNELSDSLLTLFHKRSELRKLIKQSSWTVDRTPLATVYTIRGEQDEWVQTQGSELLEAVKLKCDSLRNLVDNSKRDSSSQLQPVLLKENEIMVSWDEITRLLSIQSIIVDQATTVEMFNNRVKEVINRADLIQDRLESQSFEDNFLSSVDVLLEDIENLNSELCELHYPDFPEAQGTNLYISNHFKHTLQALTQHLLDSKVEYQSLVEGLKIKSQLGNLLKEGQLFSDYLTQNIVWSEDAMLQINEASFEEAESFFDSLTKEMSAIEGEKESQKPLFFAWESQCKKLHHDIKNESERDELHLLEQTITSQSKHAEANFLLIQNILSNGFSQIETIPRLKTLLNQHTILFETVSQLSVDSNTLDDHSALSNELNALEPLITLDTILEKTSPAKILARYKDLVFSLSRISSDIKTRLSLFEANICATPFHLFNEESSQFISLGKDMSEHIQDSLEACKVFTEDDKEILEAKASSLCCFITLLKQNIVLLKKKHHTMSVFFINIQSLPSNSLMESVLKNHSKINYLWDQLHLSFSAALAIYAQIQELTKTITQLWEVDVLIQHVRLDIQGLLEINDQDFLETQVSTIELLLIKLAQLLDKIGSFSPCSLPSGVSKEILYVSESNHRQVLDLVEHIHGNMNTTQLQFKENQVRAIENCSHTNVNNSIQWKEWCRHQSKVLEIDRRHLQVSFWNKNCIRDKSLISRALESRKSLLNLCSQNYASFNSTIKRSSSEDIETLEAFQGVQKILVAQIDALPLIKKLRDHWIIVLKDQRWISHHRKALQSRPISENSIQAVDKAMANPSSELSLSHQHFLDSVLNFDHTCKLLNDKHSIFDFLDPLHFKKLKEESGMLHKDWDYLGKLVVETRELIQAGELCRAIHEEIEFLYTQIQNLNTNNPKSIQDTAYQLDKIGENLKEQIFNQIRQMQTVFFRAPRDNSGWNIKIKLTSELIESVSRALEEKLIELASCQSNSRLHQLGDHLIQHISDFKSSINSVTKIIDKSSSFLSDIEKASQQLKEASDLATVFIDKHLDHFIKDSRNQTDSIISAKSKGISLKWEEVTRASQLLESKITKRIEFKRKAAEAQSEKKIQRAKSRTIHKYVPPDKNKVGSRYMSTDKKAKENELTKETSKVFSPNHYVPDNKNPLDVEVARIVNSFPKLVQIERDPELGKYWIGSRDPKLCFCRVLSSTMVMVRIGGGWVELPKYLAEHCDDHDLRSSSRAASRSSRSASRATSRPIKNMLSSDSLTNPRIRRDRSISNPSRQGSTIREFSPLSSMYESPRSKTPNGLWEDSISYTKHTLSSRSKSRSSLRPSSQALSPSSRSRLTSPLGKQNNSLNALLSPRALKNSHSIANFRSTEFDS